MKKLFTFFVAFALVAVAFAQFQPKPMYPAAYPNTNNDRSSWKGDGTVDAITDWEEDETYFIRLNQFATLQPGYTLDKVAFYYQSDVEDVDDDGNPVTINFFNEFDIIIWTGGSASWIVQNPNVAELDSAVYYTNDASYFGTQVYTQHVTHEGGTQSFTLTTPYTVTGTEGEIWVGIHCCGYTCGGVATDHLDINTPWGDFLDYYYSSNETHPGWNLYVPLYYADPARTQVKCGHNAITVHVNDGGSDEIMNDWYVKVMDPADQSEHPSSVEAVTVDPDLDSLYFQGGVWNGGVDAATTDATISIYMINDNGENLYYWQDQAMGISEEDPTDVNWGLRFGPMAIIGADELEDYNLTYPFQVCISVTPVENVDPNLDDNVACATYDIEHVGINEVNTTSLNVYPNPACNVINVDNAAGAQISIYNIAGQEVMAIEAANANESINVASLSEGVYVVRVVNGNEVATSKVSIVR